MNQKRQPKGTSDGGKFAPDVNQESTVALAAEPILAMVVESVPSTKYHCDNCDSVSFEEIHDCGATCREIDPSGAEDMGLNDADDMTNVEMDGVVVASYRHVDIDHGHATTGAEPDDGLAADLDLINNPPPIIEQNEQFIANAQDGIQLIREAKEAREDGGGDTLDQLIEEGQIVDTLHERIILYQSEIIDEQRKELEALRKDAGGFNLNRAIFDNVCATIEIRREHVLGETSNEDVYEKARLTDPEIEQVRALVDAHLENGISRGGDKAIGYLIEEESEYCMSEIESKLGDILKEDE
jgi:hypothetical protein